MFFKNKKKYKENSITLTGLQPSVRRTVALSKATAFVSKQRLFLTLEPDDVYPNKAYILNEPWALPLGKAQNYQEGQHSTVTN